MKKLLVLLISVLLNASLYADEPFETYNFPSSSITKFEINTIDGNITLTGVDSEKATVEVFINGKNKTADEMKQMLAEFYTIDISVVSGKMLAVVKHKNKLRSSKLNISFIISIPKHVSGKMNSASGNIRISETSGDLSVNTASGSVTVDHVSGKISGNTASGNINLSNSTGKLSLNIASGDLYANSCTGSISVNVASGNISANKLEGDISFNTASGNLTADNIIGNLKASSASGNIVLKDISGNLAIKDGSKRNNERINNNRGNIDITMKSVDKHVIISNNSAEVNLTLPADNGYSLNVIADKIETSGMKDFHGEMDSKTLNGTVGSGCAKIEINKSQKVNLSFK